MLDTDEFHHLNNSRNPSYQKALSLLLFFFFCEPLFFPLVEQLMETENPSQAPQGRSWKKVIFQAILFHVVISFLSPKNGNRQRQNLNNGGQSIALKNAYQPNTTFDLYAFITSDPSAQLRDLILDKQTPVWSQFSEVYKNQAHLPIRKTKEPIQYQISPTMLNTLLTQHKLENETTQVDTQNREYPSSIVSKANLLLEQISGAEDLRRMNKRKENWKSLYLLVFGVPHNVYHKIEECQSLPENVEQGVACLQNYTGMNSDVAEHILKASMNLIEYMKPFNVEDTQSLWFGNEQQETTKNATLVSNTIEPHWKNHIDIRFVVDQSLITPEVLGNLFLRRKLKILPEDGLYLPVLDALDIWLLERNYNLLNETSMKNPTLNLTLSLNSLSIFWWTIQSQLGEIWNPSGDTPMNPLLALQKQSKSETFMLKRVILDTNVYLLIFSALFMILHSIFSFLALKNDIQFWHQNKSLHGLSVLGILFNFLCDLIVALYLYDSKETSYLVLFEIFLGLILSAWKVTKAIKISWIWIEGKILPRIVFKNDQTYSESETKKYDQVAIRFMSKYFLLPCTIGYAIYSLRYHKFRSWYSFIISTLAGTVYTFGFITMTPQLYLNYKLKSVDHLPWRAFTYKALNTFVDDIAAFIIDMPWMHRLACFRDDIIFICYLYQRWIYRSTVNGNSVNVEEVLKETETDSFSSKNSIPSETRTPQSACYVNENVKDSPNSCETDGKTVHLEKNVTKGQTHLKSNEIIDSNISQETMDQTTYVESEVDKKTLRQRKLCNK